MLSVGRTRPCPISTGRSSKKAVKPLNILDLPSELGDLVIGRLDSRTLSSLACVCRVLNHQTSRAARWKALFGERWGVTKLQELASQLAGGWKKLYISKAAVPDFCPSGWEIQAAIRSIVACAKPSGIACCVLIDGSGSMWGGDFNSMTSVVTQLSEALQEVDKAQISVIQFSGRTQVEIPMQAVNPAECQSVMERVTRMNGGTNIAAACGSAAAETSRLDADIQRVFIIMSDFRIDDFSASDAIEAAQKITKQQPNTAFFAFGVGRFVDESLVASIMAAGSPPQAVENYLWLGYQEDSPVDDY